MYKQIIFAIILFILIIISFHLYKLYENNSLLNNKITLDNTLDAALISYNIFIKIETPK